MGYTVGMSFARRLNGLLVAVITTVTLSACGAPAEPTVEFNPLQSPLGTAQAQTSVVAAIVPTATPTATGSPTVPTVAVPTVPPATSIANPPAPNIVNTQPTNATLSTSVGTPTATALIPFGTISPTLLTSTAVVATITALAASPTYPPTDTPRPRRRPVIIGAAGDSVPPTTAPDKTGITVQTKSDRVFPGGPATLTVKTKAKAACELSNIRLDNSGKEVLEPVSSGSARTAGSDGAIAWIWKVDADEPYGTMRLVIMCPDVGVKQISMEVSQ